jgi:putative toxin-antitoxin system antitoxin component (TIGR02293 family)
MQKTSSVATPSLRKFTYKLPATDNRAKKPTLDLTMQCVDSLIAQVERGLSYSFFETLCSEMDLSSSRLAQVVSIPPRTLARRKKEGRFQAGESDRIMRYAMLFEQAVAILGSKKDAAHWFASPIQTLHNRSPFDYARTEIGGGEVRNVLGRIEHGIVA